MRFLNKTVAWMLILIFMTARPISAAFAAELSDGIYEATAPGMNGDITVRAAVLDGEILKITTDHSESAEVGAPAIEELIRRVMDVQDPDVDIVTGATETSEAFVEAMKAALTQAGWEEEALDVVIIHRETPAPVAEVSAPQINFPVGQADQAGVTLVPDDTIVMNWHAEGEVQSYHVEIIGGDGRTIKAYETTEEEGFVQAAALAEGEVCALTVTAIPANGTLEANGVSASALFALFVAPTSGPTLKPVLQTGEISDSWDQIIAAIEDGSARQRYAIGATKELDLGKLGLIHMQLAGFDLDERADGGGKAATTWIAVELLPEEHYMNKNPTAEGGWLKCDLRTYLHNTLLPTIPEAVQNKLIRVKKKQRDFVEGQGHYQISEDLVWIPDNDEISGQDALYFDLFQNSSEKRVKQCNGSASWWWLRSAGNYITFGYVNSNGNYSGSNASSSYGVALGFCL